MTDDREEDYIGLPPEPDPPAQRHSRTSVAAAERIRPKVGTYRARVLEAIERSPDGLTDEEGAALLGMSPNTYRPRRVELWNAGHVRDRNRTRPTKSGSSAVVWYPARN